jgi:hypothetical protein
MSLRRSNVKLVSNWTLAWILAPSVALVALTASSQSQSLSDVSLRYLQRHGVPCQSVVKVDSTDNLDQIAICQDGREWAMFWLEDEVAFVVPVPVSSTSGVQTSTVHSLISSSARSGYPKFKA